MVASPSNGKALAEALVQVLLEIRLGSGRLGLAPGPGRRRDRCTALGRTPRARRRPDLEIVGLVRVHGLLVVLELAETTRERGVLPASGSAFAHASETLRLERADFDEEAAQRCDRTGGRRQDERALDHRDAPPAQIRALGRELVELAHAVRENAAKQREVKHK